MPELITLYSIETNLGDQTRSEILNELLQNGGRLKFLVPPLVLILRSKPEEPPVLRQL